MNSPAYIIQPPLPGAGGCVLTLTMPHALEETLIDALLDLPDALGPYTVLHGHALGPTVKLNSAMEQVQGRAERVFVQVLLPAQGVQPLVQALRDAVAHPDVVWCTTPILDSGRLA